MTEEMIKQEDLSQKERAKLIIDFFHRTMVHHALWYAEVKHQIIGRSPIGKNDVLLRGSIAKVNNP